MGLLKNPSKFDQMHFLGGGNARKERAPALYCADNVSPSIDPEVFFRAQLLSYIYDLGGDRQLCEEVRVNIAYRWFVRLALEDEVFVHSSMTRI
jgi:transposase